MAGSAGSPPETLTVKLCQCGEVWSGGNAKYCPSGHAYAFEKVEYVPREQSDALALRAEKLLDSRGLDRVDMADELADLELALNAYREATQ
jgi:hypothetical protein